MKKLGEMLAVGRSLIGISDNSNRYRMPKRNWLPRFSLIGNPFRRPAAQEPPSEGGGALAHGASGGGTRRAGDATDAGPPRALGSLGDRGASGDRGATSAGSTSRTRRAAQPELSLDHVTVVRNDFSEFDAEAEPLLARVHTPAAAVAMPRRIETAASRALGRLQAALLPGGGARAR